jgi:putative metalloprotease
VVFSVGCSTFEGGLGRIPGSDLVSAGANLARAVSLSDEETARLCREVAMESDTENVIAQADSPYQVRLTRLVKNLASEDGLNLNFKVYIDPEVNAFSLADGSIRIHSGLMDTMNDDELLSVIGHEIGHVKLGHSKSRMQRAYAASAALSAARGSLRAGMGSSAGSVAGAVGTSVAAGLAAEVIKAQFSQSDETDADEYGASFLAKHGADPGASVTALLKLSAETGEEEQSLMAQFTSSHPGSKDRAEHMREFIAQLDVKPAQPIVVAAHNVPAAERVSAADKLPSAEQVQNAEYIGDNVNEVESVDSVTIPRQVELEPQTAPRPQPSVLRGWYVQLAAYPDSTTSEAMVRALRDRQERASTHTAEVKGVNYTRVLVGPYPSKNNAQIELDRIVSHGIFEGDPFVRKLD